MQSTEYPVIAPSQCMPCLEGAVEHFDWHPKRSELLKIGKEMTARARAREDRTVALMSDDELVAYGIRMRRLLASAAEDEWPDFLVALVSEWVRGAEKEWRWRQRAARLGADAVVRWANTWPERIQRVKERVDLLLLIGGETGGLSGWYPKYKCRCPFHDDRDPSLDFNIDKGVWMCRVCQIGGDAIRYAELRHGYSFTEAIVYLEERAGIPPPQKHMRSAPLGGVPIVT